MPNTPITRILDASANRASEGLRVAEDYLRFVLDDKHLTQLLKQLRHDLAENCVSLLCSDRFPARDTPHDVGTKIATDSETRRADAWNVCAASLARVKQSLRSLEEFSKIGTPTLARAFEAMRYRLYTLEKAIAVTQDSRSAIRDASLCVLVDGKASEAAFEELVDQLCSARVGMIQFRDKRLSDNTLVARAKALCAATTRKCRDSSRPLVIINDRPDIAAAANADGVHLGQDDLSVKDARRILGPRKLIGVSTHSLEQARAAVLDGANYLGAGPTFPSSTKSFKAFPGLDYLRQVTDEISLPTFAIGGIQTDNLPQVLETGVGRVAVGSAVTDSANPGKTASHLLKILNDAAAQRSQENCKVDFLTTKSTKDTKK